MYGLRIVIAENDQQYRSYLKKLLVKEGYTVVGEAGDGRNALQLTYKLQPDLLLISAQLPGKDGLEVAELVSGNRIASVVIMCDVHRLTEVKRSMGRYTYSYVLKPVDEYNIAPVIETTVMMERKIRTLESEKANLKQMLETRKLVEQAKGLLVQTRGMTEQQAYKYLQKTSMDKCKPMAEMARLILSKVEAGVSIEA